MKTIKNNKEEIYMPDKREHSNITVFLLFSVTSGIAANICSEGYIQAYMMKLGFDTAGIRNYGIISQVLSIAAYMICTRLTTMKQRLKKIYAAAVLGTGVFPSVLAAAGYIPSFTATYIIVLAAAALYSFLMSFRAVAEFNMTPHLFSRSQFGNAVSKSMVISGVITVIISVAGGSLFKSDGANACEVIFCVPVAALLISSFLTLLYKFDGIETNEIPSYISYYDVIKAVASLKYMIRLSPHFLRGAAMAGMYYIVPSVLDNITFSDTERSYLIIISVISTTAGSFLFIFLNKKINSGIITLISTVICSALMPLLVLCSTKYLFFIFYFVFSTANIITQISIPTGVLRSTSNGELSLISSMRLLLMSAASSLFIFIFGISLKYIAPVYIMLFSGVVFILCGAIYKEQFDDHI